MLKSLVIIAAIFVTMPSMAADVYRDGDTIVFKGVGICVAISLANVKKELPNLKWTPLKSLLYTAIDSPRELYPNEHKICFDTAPITSVWTVAPISSGKRPIYLSKPQLSGGFERVKTGEYLAAGMPCADDETNVYTYGYKGGKRMWRNIPESVDFIVYCSKK